MVLLNLLRLTSHVEVCHEGGERASWGMRRHYKGIGLLVLVAVIGVSLFWLSKRHPNSPEFVVLRDFQVPPYTHLSYG